MNEEYLWDTTGKPDPEIQQLEEILGTLRYQPKPLDLDVEAQSRLRNSYLPLIAIAATLIVALIAGAIWLLVRTKTSRQVNYAKIDSSRPQQVSPPLKDNEKQNAVVLVPDKTGRNGQPGIKRTRHSRTLQPSNLSASERQQALEAKEQLMIALRLTSEKLNFAHRKAQGASPNQIRNQHKVG
jgi:hypothetical protein